MTVASDPTLEAIRARLKAATPGPWVVTPLPWDNSGCTITTGRGDPHGEYIVAVTDGPMIPEDFDEIEDNRNEDADFIAHAPSDIVALLALVDAVRDVLREIRDHDGNGDYTVVLKRIAARALLGGE